MSIDTTIQGYFSNLNNPLFFWISLSTYIATVLVLIYFAYKKDKVNFSKFAIGAVAMWLIIELLKVLTGRLRPDGSDTDSFPSRHAAFGFFISYFLPVERKYKILLYTWAVLIAISRLALNLHWFTDILAGTLIGLAFAFIVKKIKIPFKFKRN